MYPVSREMVYRYAAARSEFPACFTAALPSRCRAALESGLVTLLSHRDSAGRRVLVSSSQMTCVDMMVAGVAGGTLGSC